MPGSRVHSIGRRWCFSQCRQLRRCWPQESASAPWVGISRRAEPERSRIDAGGGENSLTGHGLLRRLNSPLNDAVEGKTRVQPYRLLSGGVPETSTLSRAAARILLRQRHYIGRSRSHPHPFPTRTSLSQRRRRPGSKPAAAEVQRGDGTLGLERSKERSLRRRLCLIFASTS